MRPRAAASAALAAAVLTSSCVLRRHPDPTRFYVLAATVPGSTVRPGARALGLGPIVVPGYLQHPGLVTRSGSEVRYADLDRWAEPLPTLFVRALGENVAALLGVRIVTYPWYRGTPVDVAVGIDVRSFEADGAGHVAMDACWTIREPSTATVRGTACASIVEPVDGDGVRAEVAALGRTVGELARRVAATVRDLGGGTNMVTTSRPGHRMRRALDPGTN